MQLLVTAGIRIATILALEYKIDFAFFRKYLRVATVGLFLLVTGQFRALYRVAVVWFHRQTQEDHEPNWIFLSLPGPDQLNGNHATILFEPQ